MAPIYTNNTNHTNDTDDTHHTDNPTTIGRETSPSSFFLRNKNLGQTIKTASRTRCRMIGHALPTIPAPLSPITAARSTRSQLPILPSPLPAPIVPRSPFLRFEMRTSRPCDIILLPLSLVLSFGRYFKTT